MEKTHVCRYCSSKFKHKHSVLKHENTCKSRPTPSIKWLCEDGCGREFGRKDALARHKKPCKGYKANHICNVCDKMFHRYRDLERHMPLHDRLINTCNNCGEQFKREVNLTKHRKFHCKVMRTDDPQDVSEQMLNLQTMAIEDLVRFCS